MYKLLILSLFLCTYVSAQAGFVIESEVFSADECMEMEQYDAKRSVCFVECDTLEECERIELTLDDAIDALESEYNKLDIAEFHDSGIDEDTLQNAEAIYTIKKDRTFILTSGAENITYKKVQQWLRAITPREFSDTYLSRLVLLPSNSDNSAAFISLGDKGRWDIVINMHSLREDGEKEMVFTLIHEFAHILTLNSSQLEAEIPAKRCLTYDTSAEGCTKQNSYLNHFVEMFWKDILQKYPDAEDYYSYYEKYPSEFVRDYAATSPIEDIAESFATFILRTKRVDATLADKKVDFFYAYPELVKMRNNMRKSLKGLL